LSQEDFMRLFRIIASALLLVGVPAAAAEALEARVDPATYAQLAGSKKVTIESFPLPGVEPVELVLESFSILAPDVRLLLVTEAGSVELPRPKAHFYRGRVAGDPGSEATLTFVDGELAGSIRTSHGEFTVRPARVADGRSGGTVFIRDSADDPDRPETPFCDADPPRPPEKATPESDTPPVAAMIDAGTTLVASIAIDATYEWFERFGSATDAQNYILSLMAQVSTIYQNEVNIKIEISQLRIFTTPNDPYSDTLDAGLLLDELRDEWIANQDSVSRTATHLFGVRPNGGVGVAYVDVLCNKSFGYGVSTISGSGGSWEKSLVAHELGHNFASPHTHCYTPEIDQCATAPGCYSGPEVASTGTIMSYCSSSTPTFHPRVENETIRPAAEAAYPFCMTVEVTDPPDPPTGLTTF